MTVRREQLLGPELPEELADSLLGLNRGLVSEVLCWLATAMWRRQDGPSVEVITTCVVDLPTALLRDGSAKSPPRVLCRSPPTCERVSQAAARAVLDREPPRR